MASRFAPAAKLDRIRALDARLELVDGDFEMARDRAAAVARYDGIRLVEDSFSGRHVATIVCGSNVDLDAYYRWVGAAPVHKS